MYLERRWYTLDLVGCRRRETRREPPASTSHGCRPRVLEPILRIGDIRTDKRIDFVGGARGTEALEQAVDSGKAAVAFSLYPVTVERPDGHLGRRRHHAAEVDLVRAEAAGRAAGA